jgi:hypothetical protein
MHITQKRLVEHLKTHLPKSQHEALGIPQTLVIYIQNLATSRVTACLDSDSIRYGGYIITPLRDALLITEVKTHKAYAVEGEHASDLLLELVDTFVDLEVPGTRSSRFTPEQLADDILGAYFS